MKISDLELRRQLFHFSFGLAVVALLYYGLIGITSFFITLMLGFIASMLCRNQHVPVISWMLKTFDREDAKFPGEGAFFMVAGMFLVYGIFPKDIALASIMVLAVGDSVSHLFGKAFGRTTLHDNTSKTWAGTVSGLIAGFLGAVLFVPMAMALVGSAVAMLLEAIEVKYFGYTVDDNLLVPMAAAIAMQLWVVL